MRHLISPILCGILLISWSFEQHVTNPTPTALVAQHADTVVAIYDDGHIQGSGVVVDAKGFILTCAHVVGHQTDVAVKFYDKHDASPTMGVVVAVDFDIDLALVVVLTQPLHPIHLGDTPHAGDFVFAIGHPFGMEDSVSTGVVSGFDRVLHFPGRDQPHMLQHTAAINPGNSGGPLLDAHGRLVGINSALIRGANNMCFAVPIETVRSFLKR